MIDPSEKIRFVELSPPHPGWSQSFADEANEIKKILNENLIGIHHIGSTSIPHIYAKPIIDIMPVVKDLSQVDALNAQFEALNYICMGEYGIPGRRYYWKSKSERTHHVHLFQEGSPEIIRHLAFRDFMRKNPDYANAYSWIKRYLAEAFPYDIENYVNGKASFIQMICYKTETARPSQLEALDDVVIQPYNSAWPKLADAEIKTIKEIVSLPSISIEHIGSTAVPELSSKPIIDILIVVNSIHEALSWVHPLETLGYVFWDENPDKTHLRLFKGMPPFGEKRTHHIHIVDKENKIVHQRILFRDILRRDEKVRKEYEALKIKLANSFSSDREAYTDAKGAFIESVLKS